MKQQQKDALSPVVADLLAGYANAEPEFTYPLKNGKTIRARRLRDASEMVRLNAEVQKYTKLFQDGTVPTRLLEYKETAPDILSLCVFGAALIVEPKLSLADLLHIAKTGGKAIFDIATPAIEAATISDTLGTMEQVENEGEDFGATPSTEPAA